MANKSTNDSKTIDRLYLQVVEETNGYSGERYYHLHARVVVQKYEGQGVHGRYVPYGPDDTYGDGLLWSGLRASCQGDQSTRLGEDGRAPVYGFDVEYQDMHSIDLRKLQRMVKTLSKVERGMEKLAQARGYARTFGEYLGRVAEVLGCAGMVFQTSAKSREMSGEQWTWLSIGDGVNRANHQIWTWQEEGKPAAGVAS